MKTILSVILFAFIANAKINAQAGTLDLNFDTDGKVTTSIGQTNIARAIAIQPDGKIILAGSSFISPYDEFSLARYNPDGSLDNTFDIDGIVSTPFDTNLAYAYSVVLQTDGKIVVAGCIMFIVQVWPIMIMESQFALARYNIDGSLDNSFDGDGKLTTIVGGASYDEAYTVAIQSDGKIIAGGYSNNGSGCFALVRYNTNGSLDNSFDSDGKVITSIGSSASGRSIVIQADGKIVLAGTSNNQFALARYNTDGTLDNSFDGDGIVTTIISGGMDWASSLAIQTDGKLVLVGDCFDGIYQNDFIVVRYNTDGSLDNSFSSDGIVTTTMTTVECVPYCVVIQPDGKIIATGSSSDGVGTHFALVRYNTDGTLDNSFDGNGMLTTSFSGNYAQAYTIAIQPDLKIVAAGTTYNGIDYDFALARYISGLNVGIADFSLDDNVLIYPNPISQEAILEYTLKNQEKITIELLNIQGKLVKTIIADQHQGAGTHQQSIILQEDVPAGYYYVVISSLTGKVSVKIMKQ